VLLLAREMGVLQLGTVALDGTKIHANASRTEAVAESPVAMMLACGSGGVRLELGCLG
jgi:hypothetical protein